MPHQSNGKKTAERPRRRRVQADVADVAYAVDPSKLAHGLVPHENGAPIAHHAERDDYFRQLSGAEYADIVKVHEINKTVRTWAICGTVVAGIGLISWAAVRRGK